jgi:uncharacterized phiE125 gp8 family phage protein
MRLTLSAAPTTTPVALAEVRSWLNLTPGLDEDDAVIERLIDEAYDELESMTNRKFLGQTWAYTIDSAGIASEIRLPLVPLVSVSSIKTTDDDGDETTVTSTNYQIRGGENPRVVLTRSGQWPTDERRHDSMEITCACGYGGDVIPFVGWMPDDHTAGTLNDMTAALTDTWSGSVRTVYEFKITTAAATDKFDWRAVTTDTNGQKTFGAWTADVSITGSAQAIADKLTVTFDAKTGHVTDDQWTVEMYERLPARVRRVFKGLVLFLYDAKGRGITETVSGQIIGLPREIERAILSLRVESW